MANYLYCAVVNRYNENVLVKNIYLVARNILHASHIAEEEVFENNMFDNVPVEIASIVRIMEIDNVINCDSLFDEDDDDVVHNPLDVSGIPEDDLILFKHSCDKTIKLVNGDWGIVKCPECSKPILRRNLSLVSGMWVYIEGNL
jgi:hypothetical protein